MNTIVNYGLWVLMCVNCNKCTILVRDADNEGRQGYMGNLHLPLNFAVNLKLL